MSSWIRPIGLCVLIAACLELLNHYIPGFSLHLPMPFFPFLGVILFVSFLLLSHTPPHLPQPRWQRYGYLFMASLGLFLTTPWIQDIKGLIQEQNSKKTMENGTKFKKPKKGDFLWHTSIEEAQKAASQKKDVILIYFSADWCLPCLEMEKDFFPSAGFKQFVKEYSPTLLFYDMDQKNSEGEEIAQKYLMRGLPTMILIDHKGVEIDKVLGYRSKEKTIRELKEVIRMYRGSG